jgi:hypothetical protein
VNNAFIRKSTTYYTLDSVEGSPYTLSSDGRTSYSEGLLDRDVVDVLNENVEELIDERREDAAEALRCYICDRPLLMANHMRKDVYVSFDRLYEVTDHPQTPMIRSSIKWAMS